MFKAIACSVVSLLAAAVILRSCSKSSAPPAPRVFDLRKRDVVAIGWPTNLHSFMWDIEFPGPVEFLLPRDKSFKLNPELVGFLRYPNSCMVSVSAPSRRLSVAYQHAQEFCRQFQLPTHDLEHWYTTGSQQIGQKSSYDTQWYYDGMMYGLTIFQLGQSPADTKVVYKFGWKTLTRDGGAIDIWGGKDPDTWPAYSTTEPANQNK